VPEVGLDPLPGIVVQRNEGLLLAPTPLADVPPHLVVAALVALLDQPPEDLRGVVPLLSRGRLVRRQDLLDPPLEPPIYSRDLGHSSTISRIETCRDEQLQHIRCYFPLTSTVSVVACCQPNREDFSLIANVPWKVYAVLRAGVTKIAALDKGPVHVWYSRKLKQDTEDDEFD